jgi:uncharacterized coiled-coil protein SlyX
MRIKDQKNDITPPVINPGNRSGDTPDEVRNRLQLLEERFLYQEQTIDALNEVIIEQQAQLDTLEDHLSRLEAMFTTVLDNPGNGEEPPPPHY